jgi:hypothetical protein
MTDRRLGVQNPNCAAALRRIVPCEFCGKAMQASALGPHKRGCTPGSKEARFWEKVEKRGDDDCWGWKGHLRWDGYGRFRHMTKAVFAHRYSYELHHGQIPEGMSVMHVCDNPICTNPKHLRLGTHAENMADMKAKGRGSQGRRKAA